MQPDLTPFPNQVTPYNAGRVALTTGAGVVSALANYALNYLKRQHPDDLRAMGDQATAVITRQAKRVADWAVANRQGQAAAKQEVVRRIQQTKSRTVSRSLPHESFAQALTVPFTGPLMVRPIRTKAVDPRLGRLNDKTVIDQERAYLHGYYGARRPGMGALGRMDSNSHPSKSLTYRRHVELGFTIPENSKFIALADPIISALPLLYACLTQTAVTAAHAGESVNDYYPSSVRYVNSNGITNIMWTNRITGLTILQGTSTVADTVLPPTVEGAAFSPLGGSFVANVTTPQGTGASWVLVGPDSVPSFIDRCGTLRQITSSAEGGLEAPTIVGTASLVNPASTVTDLVMHLSNVGSYGGYVENQAALSKRWATSLMDPPAINWLRAVSDSSVSDLVSYYNADYTQQGSRIAALGGSTFYMAASAGTVVSLDFAYDYAVATGEASPLKSLRSINAQIPPGNIEARVNAGCTGFGDSFKESFREAVAASRASAISNGGSVAKLVNPDKFADMVELAVAPGLVNQLGFDCLPK